MSTNNDRRFADVEHRMTLWQRAERAASNPTCPPHARAAGVVWVAMDFIQAEQCHTEALLTRAKAAAAAYRDNVLSDHDLHQAMRRIIGDIYDEGFRRARDLYVHALAAEASDDDLSA